MIHTVQDSNTQPLDHRSPLITTSSGMPQLLLVLQVLKMFGRKRLPIQQWDQNWPKLASVVKFNYF